MKSLYGDAHLTRQVIDVTQSANSDSLLLQLKDTGSGVDLNWRTRTSSSEESRPSGIAGNSHYTHLPSKRRTDGAVPRGRFDILSLLSSDP
jgi:hypothetical protein